MRYLFTLALSIYYIYLYFQNEFNIFLIYSRAIMFDEPKLADVCLRYLDRQIDKVLVTEEFLDIDEKTLYIALLRENLRINECVLFKAVLK